MYFAMKDNKSSNPVLIGFDSAQTIAPSKIYASIAFKNSDLDILSLRVLIPQVQCIIFQINLVIIIWNHSI